MHPPAVDLPLELRLEIISQLTRGDLFRLRAVSHHWKEAAHMDSRFSLFVWFRLGRRRGRWSNTSPDVTEPLSLLATSTPLTIRVTNMPPLSNPRTRLCRLHRPFQAAMNTTTGHLSSIRTLDLTIPGDLWLDLERTLCQGPALSLQEMKLAITNDTYAGTSNGLPFCLSAALFSRSAPWLRRIELINISLGSTPIPAFAHVIQVQLTFRSKSHLVPTYPYMNLAAVVPSLCDLYLNGQRWPLQLQFPLIDLHDSNVDCLFACRHLSRLVLPLNKRARVSDLRLRDGKISPAEIDTVVLADIDAARLDRTASMFLKVKLWRSSFWCNTVEFQLSALDTLCMEWPRLTQRRPRRITRTLITNGRLNGHLLSHALSLSRITSNLVLLTMDVFQAIDTIGVIRLPVLHRLELVLSSDWHRLNCLRPVGESGSSSPSVMGIGGVGTFYPRLERVQLLGFTYADGQMPRRAVWNQGIDRLAQLLCGSRPVLGLTRVDLQEGFDRSRWADVVVCDDNRTALRS